jgi:hypothetical protein
MNSKQAKELSLPDFLGRLGHEPARTRGNDIWYTSPFRPNEKTPSFKIDHQKNVWFDFGMGQGGTIIDLVQNLYRTPDVAKALSIIADVDGGVAHACEWPTPCAEAPQTRPVIESVGGITDRMLEQYVRDRAIPLDLARVYLQEIRYRAGDRDYRALAFANDSGGFEVRNPGFKGTIGKKDISYLPNRARNDAAVFEGAFDFLSTLAHYERDRPESNVLVLNSVGMAERGMARLDAHGIQRVHAYLDHDPAGEGVLARLKQRGPLVHDASGFYLGFKDANEFLQDRRKRERERYDGRDR